MRTRKGRPVTHIADIMQTAPVIPVIVVVLAFNFFGDGLRDAADPYR